ncbi:MAG: glycoside hydrolase family 43 protein [Spirochaetes bacterium]|nr:glycoside hydrolase family 43 protein [Spirochaetota bacterium]
MIINNPVLKGFHPDPSILRVDQNGEADFYIANSTFEWWPGVRIYHSKDLINWQLISQPLNRMNQLNMKGNPPSGGIWAPCLSYADGFFYLVYTDVKTWVGSKNGLNDGFKDTHNYLVYTDDIQGKWSDPVYLNSNGFDPSLFHDQDGSKWLLNLRWDYRVNHNHFSAIEIQQFDEQAHSLVGPVYEIFKGSKLGFTEGPHLYQRNGFYYLMTAEGGTSYQHAVTLARSKKRKGPYELHPNNPLVTGWLSEKHSDDSSDPIHFIKNNIASGLKKTGHGSMCKWTEDEWVLAILTGRPLENTINCPLGRETSLIPLVWKEDGWPYPKQQNPAVEAFFSGEAIEKENTLTFKEDFDQPEIHPDFQFLRYKEENNYLLKPESSVIRLYGAESIVSPFNQTLLGRRITSFHCYIETRMFFKPSGFQQMAGLILRYDDYNQIYLRMSQDDQGNNCLGILVFEKNHFFMPVAPEIRIDSEEIFLNVEIKNHYIQFSYALDGKNWQKIGPEFETYKLSDEHVEPMGFTGLFACLACQDLNGRGSFAEFDYYLQRNLE